MGAFHGFRRKYLNAYPNEFVFRWNRRHSYRSAFELLVGIGVAIAPGHLRRHPGDGGLTVTGRRAARRR